MKLLMSLFDGSGGFPLAGAICGIEPVAASEVEPYPIAVTKNRFPNMKHLGDISKINGAEIEPVDIITFGSPCQDLSVAGKRAGLKHEANGDDETTRSGLFMEAVRIIKEMREATNGIYPRFALWENVPGAFSSNKGEDFRIVCEELIKIVEPSAVMPAVPKKGWSYSDSYIGNGWSLAYRVFDAQYWGVPQRRRRIHLVCDFRGECAGKVLFEREGVYGYFAESGAERKETSRNAESGVGTADREGIGLDIYNLALTGNKAATLSANSCMTATRNGPSVLQEIPYTLKIRSGCEGGGKGALIQEDLSATLATNNDQYLFQPVLLLDDQGGQQISVRTDGKSPTLRAEMHGNVPCVMDKVYSIENHPADSRVNIDDSGKVQTLTSRMGTGGGNVPLVMEPAVVCMATQQGGAEIRTDDKAPTITAAAGMSGNNQPVICLQGNGIDRADTAGCNGKGWREDQCYTLNTIDRPAVVYAVDQCGGKSGANFHEEKAPTLTCTHGGEPVIAFDRAAFNQGVNAQYDFEVTDSGINLTLVAKGPSGVAYSIGNGQAAQLGLSDVARTLDCMHDQQAVMIEQQPQYIVRRLTPTECARLQGFPDLWGHFPEKEDLTDEEYAFWLDVRNTHAEINGKTVKEYTKKQMLTWYNKLHTDSAEYKMWGNGIALPPAVYCMQGIAEILKGESENEH